MNDKKMNCQRRRICSGTALGLALFAAGAGSAMAQAYPAKTIKYVVPFSAGGAADNVSRLIAGHLSERLGQPVVIENKPGVSGIVGTQAVARSAPDGYTIMIGTLTTHAVNPFFSKNLGYDPVKDFVPVTLFCTYGNVLIVGANSPLTSVKQVIEKLKANPDSLTYGTSGAGTSQHLSGQLFQSLTGTRIRQVAYKGGTAALTDLMGGHIDMIFETVSAARPLIDDKRLKVLGATTKKAMTSLPGVQPIAEQGVPGFEMESWFGLFVPAGTPHEVVLRLNREMAEIVKLPDVQKRMQALGSEPAAIGPAEFATLQQAEIKKWEKVIRDAGIKAE